MNNLVILFDPSSEFCPLVFRYNRRFQDLLKSGIKPSSYRTYDRDKKRWSVHQSRIELVVSWGRRHFAHVDYSQLPDHLQIRIAQNKDRFQDAREFFNALQSATKTPYQVLHLLPSAPIEVVKAAHRALATKTHPDHGGSAEDFREVQEAYEAILSKIKG